MDNNIKTNIIDNIVAIAYYWIGEENPQGSLSIIKLLYEIDLTKKQKIKVDDLYNDFRAFFNGKYDERYFQKLNIPSNQKSDEEKLLWISATTILNLFSSGNFELAYNQLLDMSMDWNPLYVYVIESLKKQQFFNEICEWLMGHLLMAKDLLGKDEFELLGYKLEKIKN